MCSEKQVEFIKSTNNWKINTGKPHEEESKEQKKDFIKLFINNDKE